MWHLRGHYVIPLLLLTPFRTSLMTPFLKRRYSSPNCGRVKFLSTVFAKAKCKGPLFLKNLKISNFDNFWKNFKEVNQKKLKTLIITFVIFGGSPCKIGKRFDLGHFGIWVVIYLWTYFKRIIKKLNLNCHFWNWKLKFPL